MWDEGQGHFISATVDKVHEYLQHSQAHNGRPKDGFKHGHGQMPKAGANRN